MKKLILLTTFLFFTIILAAQTKLSPQKVQKANKKAVAEARMYSKKGFKPYGTSLELKQLIENFYLDVYKENSPGERTYVWAMGMGKAKSKAKAIKLSMLNAKKHIAALMVMYFQSWTSASKKATENEKKKINAAINKAENNIQQVIFSENPDKKLILIKENRGQFQVVSRVLYKQIPLRNLSRSQIIRELKKTTNWNENKMNQLLNFVR